MSASCTHCTRPSPDAFLCARCQKELRTWLLELPGWKDTLIDVVNGQTRLGESVRRSSEKTSPLLCNLDASRLLDYATSVEVEWTRDLCEQRGVQIPTGPLLAFLAAHVSAIAMDPGARICYREFKQIREDIERLVDRPQAPPLATSCPTMLRDNYGQRQCGALITLLPNENHVRCHRCLATHVLHELVDLRLEQLPHDVLFTASQCMTLMVIIRQPVAESTWRRWRAIGKVAPAGELYGEPAYRIQDVREFRRKWTREKAS